MEIKDSINGSDIKKGVQLGRGGFADVFRSDIVGLSKIYLPKR